MDSYEHNLMISFGFQTFSRHLILRCLSRRRNVEDKARGDVMIHLKTFIRCFAYQILSEERCCPILQKTQVTR